MEFPEVTAEMEGRKSERVEKNHGYCSVREANDEERERERGEGRESRGRYARFCSGGNAISRGQDENAFAVSKCRHFSSWRSIHCEREMSPFRKIDWRCSCRFRGKFSPVFDSFLSVHGAGVTTLLPIPLRTSIGRDRERERFSTDLSSSRGGEGERKAIFASAS